MKQWSRAVLGMAVGLALGAGALSGQEARAGNGADPPTVRVFLDCHAGCDFSYIRRTTPFVSWVRDRVDAHVHVLVTRQGTGSGGRLFTFKYIGQGPFDGSSFDLFATTAATDVQEEVRETITRTLRLGLVRFAAQSGAAEGLTVTWEPPGEEVASSSPNQEHDPWNAWVFTVNGNGNVSGESQRSHAGLGGRLNADRTTEDWKLSFRVNGSWNRTLLTYTEVTDTDTTDVEVEDERYTYRTTALVVRSAAAHWSLGALASASAESRLNQDFVFSFGPAVEYSFFPYEESDRRQLRFVYSPGVRYVDYEEITLFEKLEETLTGHQATIAFDATQPWGSAHISLDGSQYFHDLERFSLRLGGYSNFRIFRGFNFTVGGSVQWIRDQLYLAKAGDSIEDVLLQRRQLATDYEYGIHLGLSYRFGSTLNNIVNPRLNSHGRFF